MKMCFMYWNTLNSTAYTKPWCSVSLSCMPARQIAIISLYWAEEQSIVLSFSHQLKKSISHNVPAVLDPVHVRCFAQASAAIVWKWLTVPLPGLPIWGYELRLNAWDWMVSQYMLRLPCKALTWVLKNMNSTTTILSQKGKKKYICHNIKLTEMDLGNT